MIPKAVYGSEVRSLSVEKIRKFEVFKMLCLKNICTKRRSQGWEVVNSRKVRLRVEGTKKMWSAMWYNGLGM